MRVREQIDALLSDMQTVALLLPPTNERGYQRMTRRETAMLSKLFVQVARMLVKVRNRMP